MNWYVRKTVGRRMEGALAAELTDFLESSPRRAKKPGVGAVSTFLQNSGLGAGEGGKSVILEIGNKHFPLRFFQDNAGTQENALASESAARQLKVQEGLNDTPLPGRGSYTGKKIWGTGY